MISQISPSGSTAAVLVGTGSVWRKRCPVRPARGDEGADGPVRVQLHLTRRCEGARIDPGRVPGGARPRWVRWPLLLSQPGLALDRCGRQCPAAGNRRADRALSSVLGPAGRIPGRPLWHQRDAQARRRGTGDAVGLDEGPHRHRGRGGVRGPRPQVSDLGTGPLPRAAHGGHREGARAQARAWFPGCGAGRARSTGMTGGRGTDSSDAAGGLAPHVPVLARRVVEYLAPRDGGLYVDATFGAGGHTRVILDAADCRVIGIDRDQDAVALGAALVEAAAGRLVLVQGRFSELEAVLASAGATAVDGIVFDLGVSSMQLDQPERGFSFRYDGPLDMRMGGGGPAAADVIAAMSERELAAVVATLGEE